MIDLLRKFPVALKPVLTFFFLVIVMLAGPAQVLSAEDDLSQFLQEIEERSATVTSVSCRFTQERNLSIFAKTVLFQGHLLLRKPDRLRWEFVEPVPSVLILNGAKGLRCSGGGPPQEFNLATNPVMRSVSRQLWNWMNGAYSTLRDTYRIEHIPDGPGIRLYPQDAGMSSAIDSIEIFFDSETLQPVRVEILETGSDRTTIKFFEQALNVMVDDDNFIRCR